MRASVWAAVLLSVPCLSAQSLADDLLKDAIAAQRKGDLKRAEFLLRQIKDANPKDAVWEIELVNVLRSQNKLKDAIEFWREQMVGHETSVMRHQQLAYMLVDAGKQAEATQELETILRISTNPTEQARVYVSIGDIYRRNDQPEEAIAAFRKARELGGNPNILLAQLLSDRGDHRGAAAEYREMVNRNAMGPLGQGGLAYELAELGEGLNEALLLARKSLSTGATSPDLLHMAGWVYFKNGMLADAEAMMLRSLMQEGGGGRKAWDHLAAVMDARGDWSGDRRELRKLLGGDVQGNDLLRVKDLLRKM